VFSLKNIGLFNMAVAVLSIFPGIKYGNLGVVFMSMSAAAGWALVAMMAKKLEAQKDLETTE